MRRLLIKFGLRFEDPSDEQRFVERFTLDDLGRTQAAMVLGAFVYCAFSAWDWILNPTVWITTALIRAIVAIVVLLPLTAALFRTRWQADAELIYLVYCVVPGCMLSVIYLMLVAGFDHAAAGTIIVILFVSTLLPLRAISLLIFCIITWICFVICENLVSYERTGLRFINNFEIGMSYTLALYAVAAREYRARRQFLTAQALQREKERSEAALSELKNAQAHLVQAEKLASLGQLVAGVAHEVNTPIGLALTTSTTFETEVIQFEQVVESGQVRRSELLQIISRLKQGSHLLFLNLSRAAELVHSFKQVAIDQTNEERRAFEVRSWLVELMSTLEPLLRRKGHEVIINCDPGIIIDTFPGALAQVISNLSLNAVTHAFSDGRAGVLTLTVTNAEQNGICFVFEDNGDGIPEENLRNVFDPFFTTRRDQGSTGLGLHIVFNLVVSTLCGMINLESKIDNGTRFTFVLPYSLENKRAGRDLAST